MKNLPIKTVVVHPHLGYVKLKLSMSGFVKKDGETEEQLDARATESMAEGNCPRIALDAMYALDKQSLFEALRTTALSVMRDTANMATQNEHEHGMQGTAIYTVVPKAGMRVGVVKLPEGNIYLVGASYEYERIARLAMARTTEIAAKSVRKHGDLLELDTAREIAEGLHGEDLRKQLLTQATKSYTGIHISNYPPLS